MRKIASFGEWVIRHWVPLSAILILIVMAIYGSCYGVQTVTLSAKHWECTMAVPDGISTRCTEYNYKGK